MHRCSGVKLLAATGSGTVALSKRIRLKRPLVNQNIGASLTRGLAYKRTPEEGKAQAPNRQKPRPKRKNPTSHTERSRVMKNQSEKGHFALSQAGVQEKGTKEAHSNGQVSSSVPESNSSPNRVTSSENNEWKSRTARPPSSFINAASHVVGNNSLDKKEVKQESQSQTDTTRTNGKTELQQADLRRNTPVVEDDPSVLEDLTAFEDDVLADSDDEEDEGPQLHIRGRYGPRMTRDLKSSLLSNEDSKVSYEISNKCSAALQAINKGQHATAQALAVQTFIFASQAATYRKEENRSELTTSEVIDLTRLAVALCAQIENTSYGKTSFRLFPAALAQFPFVTVFETLMDLSWWGSAESLLGMMERHVVPLETRPQSVSDDLSRMLETACAVGLQPPYPKDSLPIAFHVLRILRDPIMQGRRKGTKSFEETTKYNGVMRLCIRHHDVHGDKSLIARALSLYQEMEEQGLRPTLATWCNVMNAYGRLGRLDKVLDTFNRLLALNVPPHVAIANSVVDMCCRCGDMERAEQYLDNMRFRVPWKVGSNYEQPLVNVLWNKTLGFNSDGYDDDPAIFKQENSKRALVEEPEKEPEREWAWPSPTSNVYNRLMKAYATKHNIDKVHALYTDMKARGIPSDGATASILSSAFENSAYGLDLMRMEFPERVPTRLSFIQGKDFTGRDGIFEGDNFRGLFTNKLDLHGFSRTQATIIVSAYLDSIGSAIAEMDKQRNEHGLPRLHTKDLEEGNLKRIGFLADQDCLIIVTGQGIGDEKSGRKGPILRRRIISFLASLQIPHFSPPNNPGRIYIPLSCIRNYTEEKNKKAEVLEKERNSTIQFFVTLAGVSTISLLPFLTSLF